MFSDDTMEAILAAQTAVSRAALLTANEVVADAALGRTHPEAATVSGMMLDIHFHLGKALEMAKAENTMFVDKQPDHQEAKRKPRKAKKAKAAKVMEIPTHMTPNDQKLYTALKASITDEGEAKHMTIQHMSERSGVPYGSITISLKRLVAMGKVVAQRGSGHGGVSTYSAV